MQHGLQMIHKLYFLQNKVMTSLPCWILSVGTRFKSPWEIVVNITTMNQEEI